MKKLKILFVSHEKGRNGSTVSMITLIKELEEKYDCIIHVLIPGSGQAEDTLKKNDIKCHKIRYYTNFRYIGKYKPIIELIKEVCNAVAIEKMRKIIKKNQFEYICSNSSAVDIGARAAEKYGIKHIYYIREFMGTELGLEYRNKTKMRKLIEGSNKVVFISQGIANKYTSLYQISSFKIIYNGIIKEKYFIENNEILTQPGIRLIQIGVLRDAKGTKESVAFIHAMSKKIKCHLTLVGNGSEKYLKELCTYIKQNKLEENITIIPYTEDIITLFKKADILLMNSHSEGFGRVTVEGMLGGLLVMGRDAMGTNEIISHEKNGILYRNKMEFCQFLYKINENREYYRKLAKQGQKFAQENFRPEDNAYNLLQYLKE